MPAGANGWKAHLAGKNPRLLVDIKLMTNPWALKARKTNGILGCIWKSCQQAKGFISPGKPHVEHCAQFWVPQYKRDTNTLETVQ